MTPMDRRMRTRIDSKPAEHEPKRGILAQGPGMAPMMPDINLPGLDFASYNLRSPDPRQCEQLCAQNPQCKAWTYVKPYTIQGPTPRCWLKNAVPRAQRNTCCVSGIKQQRR